MEDSGQAKNIAICFLYIHKDVTCYEVILI